MKKTFKLEGIDCANCAAQIERKIAKISDVSDVSINFFTAKLNYEVAEENAISTQIEIEKIIKKSGKNIKITQQ